MNASAKAGAILIAAGLAIWLFTPFSAVVGDHHFVRHILGYAAMGLGAVCLLAGARGR